MWHPRVRTRRTGGFRSHGSHASVVQADATGQSISQSIISNVPTTNCYMYIHIHTGGGIDKSSGRFVQTVMGNEVAKPSDDDHHGRTARLSNGAFLAAQLQETLRNGAYPPDRSLFS